MRIILLILIKIGLLAEAQKNGKKRCDASKFDGSIDQRGCDRN